MKKLLVTLAVVGSVAVPAVAMAAANSPLAPSYQAVYCYPTGSYWVKQISKFPAYYERHNARFERRYGAGTRYCP